MSMATRFAGLRAVPTRRWLQIAIVVALHLAAFVLMARTEADWFAWGLFLLSWGAINWFWLLVLRRPATAAALSLAMFQLIILLSQFKFSILWMTISFFDVLIIDPDTIAFLLTIFPDLRTTLLFAAVLLVPLMVVVWRADPFVVPRWASAFGGTACLAGIVALSLSKPEQPWEPFQGVNHVSGFVRSGAMSISELMTRGWLDFDPETTDKMRMAAAGCQPARKPPHIVLILDEASFDITEVPNIKVPPDYARHFRSVDGKTRSFLVEGSGGPTWYTEYNVLTGLSVRSYGRFAYYVTRIAAGRVERGLPQALRRCGYKTFTLYPAYGAFLSARRFQQSAGVERMIDSHEMKAGDVEPDHFYYEQALRLIRRERGGQPLFVFAYTVANHFPWDSKYRPDLTPHGWQAPGNGPEVDEYIRRQMMSAQDYRDFIAKLKREFPDESFLVVRFGDHQPALAARIIDPALDRTQIARRVMANDPRYFTTYYAIDAVNFAPADLSSALDLLDAAYLPIAIQEAAGVPLDPTFAEQKKILQRCQGLFALCAGGAEARRFNRLLIDAGLIKGLASR
jgi:hypothetical protein